MVDNFKEWLNLCKTDFDGENVHYGWIIQRDKDIMNEDERLKYDSSSPVASYNGCVIHFFIFRNVDDVTRSIDTFKTIGNKLKARVYVSINPVKYSEAITSLAHTFIDRIITDKQDSFVDITCCGIVNAPKDVKRLFVDVDDEMANYISTIEKTLANCGCNILGTLNSNSGYHIIIEDFDIKKFYKETERYVVIDDNDAQKGLTMKYFTNNIKDIHIMYNCLTNLYIPNFD